VQGVAKALLLQHIASLEPSPANPNVPFNSTTPTSLHNRASVEPHQYKVYHCSDRQEIKTTEIYALLIATVRQRHSLPLFIVLLNYITMIKRSAYMHQGQSEPQDRKGQS
jgi:hypothetical protein